MDGGAWWAIVHRIAKSQTRLSNLTNSLLCQHHNQLTAVLWDTGGSKILPRGWLRKAWKAGNILKQKKQELPIILDSES